MGQMEEVGWDEYEESDEPLFDDDGDWEPEESIYDNWDDPMYDDIRDRLEFADPGGNSALRAASASNPRNLPCPNCGEPNRLTPADRARGYQCDACADRAERGYDY